MVSDDDDVDNACRLYLLLFFSVFYFPRTSRTVSNMPFKDLDNLDNLSDYNWVESFHSFFISALNRGCKVVREKINTRSLNLAGSVVVVQVIILFISFIFVMHYYNFLICSSLL